MLYQLHEMTIRMMCFTDMISRMTFRQYEHKRGVGGPRLRTRLMNAFIVEEGALEWPRACWAVKVHCDGEG